MDASLNNLICQLLEHYALRDQHRLVFTVPGYVHNRVEHHHILQSVEHKHHNANDVELFCSFLRREDLKAVQTEAVEAQSSENDSEDIDEDHQHEK